MTEQPSTERPEPGIWRPRPHRVPVFSLFDAPPLAGCVPVTATRWMARLAGPQPVEAAADHPVREPWIRAAAGGVVAAFVGVSAMVAAVSVEAIGGAVAAMIAAGLLWAGLIAAAYRPVLRAAPRHHVRWRKALTAVWAAGVGLVGAVPISIAQQFGSLGGVRVIGPALAGVVTLTVPAILVALAALPVPTLWPRTTVDLPEVATVYLTRLPIRRTIRVGLAARASLWLGGQRDDVAGRWAVADRLHHVRAGLIVSCLLVAAVAAGTALDAVTGDAVAALSGGVLWGWTCAAVARHHLVVADDTSGRRSRLMVLSSVVVSMLVGACTGALLTIGVLARTVPPRAAGPVDGFGGLLPLAGESGGVPYFATLTVLAFALFVQLLPVLPWSAGGVLGVQRRLVALLDVATLSADRDQENECPPPSRCGESRPAERSQS